MDASQTYTNEQKKLWFLSKKNESVNKYMRDRIQVDKEADETSALVQTIINFIRTAAD